MRYRKPVRQWLRQRPRDTRSIPFMCLLTHLQLLNYNCPGGLLPNHTSFYPSDQPFRETDPLHIDTSIISGGSRNSQRGMRQLQRGGMPTYYLTNFSGKLHKNEKKLAQRGDIPCAPLDPPLIIVMLLREFNPIKLFTSCIIDIISDYYLITIGA